MLRPLNFALSALLVPFSICVSLAGNETTLDAIYGPLHCINYIQATVNTLVHSAICEVENRRPDTDEHRDFGYDSDDHFEHQPIGDGHMSDDSHEEDNRLSRQYYILPEGERHYEDSPTPPEVDHHQDINDLDEPQQTAGDVGVLNVELAPGFREHLAIRLLYLQTALGSISGSDTVVESNDKLTDGLNLIELANPDILESTSSSLKSARTLVTCKQRLGINVDDFIEQRPICTACYKYYAPKIFDALKKPNCTEKKCKGIVYREKRGIPDPKTGKESIKRIPAKIHSYSPILSNIERLLLRPDSVSALRDNKIADEPLVPDDIPMHDIYDGEAYRTVEIGLRRVIDPDLDGAIAGYWQRLRTFVCVVIFGLPAKSCLRVADRWHIYWYVLYKSSNTILPRGNRFI